ncbi:MAG: DinB family protein [Acidobacteriota bacterium]
MPSSEISEFRAVRERTLSLVAGLSADDMAEQPAADRWSAGEILDHLLRSETLWRNEVSELVRLARAGRQTYLSRLITDFPLPIVGRLPPPLLGLMSVPLTVFSSFFPLSVFLAFLKWRKIPAQAPPAIAPRRGRTADELRDDLSAQAERTVAVFEDNDDLRFERLIYQHPLLGIVTAVDLLQVITTHEARHQEQLVEVLAALGVRGRP